MIRLKPMPKLYQTEGGVPSFHPPVINSNCEGAGPKQCQITRMSSASKSACSNDELLVTTGDAHNAVAVHTALDPRGLLQCMNSTQSWLLRQAIKMQLLEDCVATRTQETNVAEAAASGRACWGAIDSRKAE